jgi:hypothetical protein
VIRRATAVALLLLGAPLAAQGRPERGPVIEGRADAFAARNGGAQGALGVVLDAGTYLRVALIAGAGVERRPGDALVGAQRVEAVARFHVDPYRQAPRGVYVGGGLGARHAAGDEVRPTLVAVLGVEGRPRGGVALGLEVGVGGGARLGIAIRKARRGRR